MGFVVAGTGHRAESCEPEYIVRLKVRTKLRKIDVDAFITGMAPGYDLWAADEALELGIGVWCAIPWKGHRPDPENEELYERVLSKSKQVHYTSISQDFPGNWCYHKRNEWMVDNATRVLAYWSGKKSGGTYATVQYAKKIGKPVSNAYNYPPF